jgi:hypothetical protein
MPLEDEDAPPPDCEHCDCWHDEVPKLREQIRGLEKRLATIARINATSVRDWSADEGDAWIYGIALGWDKYSLKELAVKFRWDRRTVEMLQELMPDDTD